MNGKKIFLLMSATFLVSLVIACYDWYERYDVIVTPISGEPLKANTENTIKFEVKDKLTGHRLGLHNLSANEGAKIEAVFIDPGLHDFHLVTPKQNPNEPGEFSFTFKPETACNYKGWVDVDPRLDKEQFVRMDLNGPKICKAVEHVPSMNSYRGDYKFTLGVKASYENKLWAQSPAELTMTVTDRAGKAVKDVRLPADGLIALGIHAKDPHELEYVTPINAKGMRVKEGYRLYFTPSYAGVVRLFARVLVNGKPYVADFTVPVGE